METCRWKRESFDYYTILNKYYDEPPHKRYPRRVASSGSSFLIMVDPKTFFKRKLQDGNQSLDYLSTHHVPYLEEFGTFDDIAEVLCSILAKNLGSEQITLAGGESVEIPLVDCAKYGLAMYTDEEDRKYRGCSSQNIIDDPDNEFLVYGDEILGCIDTDFGFRSVPNTLPNYLVALERYSSRPSKNKISIDKNLIEKLITNSYFSWRTANTDNHSRNITFKLVNLSDGTQILTDAKLLDNGGAWEQSAPFFKSPKAIQEGETTEYENTFSNETLDTYLSAFFDENKNFNHNYICHHAFRLELGDLNGHKKKFRGQSYDYEYDLSALILQNPKLYSKIYKIHTNFDIKRATDEIEEQYNLKWPAGMLKGISNIDEFKKIQFSTILADYFTYTLYSKLVGKVDSSKPTKEYAALNDLMIKLPMQESIDGYFDEFMKFSKELGIKVDLSKLNGITFAPDYQTIMKKAKQMGGNDE